MFVNSAISTLSVIDAHIYNLEYTFMVVGKSPSLVIELGNAYKMKTQLINEIENGEIWQHKRPKRTVFASKMNTEKGFFSWLINNAPVA